MKIFKYIVVFTLVLSSCKTKKNVIDTNAIAKEMTARKVAKKHLATHFNKKTIDAKLKVNFNDGKINQNLSVSLKIKKDEVIWLKGTKFITVFKAKITPTSVAFYSPYAKNYFEGDFSMITKLLGVEINFNQLQNLLLGQSLQNIKEDKQQLEIIDNAYVLSPEKQATLFDIFYNISPAHFKLNKQTLVNSQKKQRLEINYPSYSIIENVVFPSKIEIKAKQDPSFTNVDFIFKSIKFDTELEMPFSIPNGYKSLEF